MQTAFAVVAGRMTSWDLPGPEDEVLPGVAWGAATDILSPAYWALLGRTMPAAGHDFVCLDGNLAAEVGFCLLGGHGVSAEIALAAYHRLDDEGAFSSDTTMGVEDLFEALRRPLLIEGRSVRYRFPRQRATRIAQALARLRDRPIHTDDPRGFRSELMTLPGVGPKTASWIVRNHTGSDAVAILDIHIVRACQAMRVFDAPVRLPRDYERLEDRFLAFAHGIGVDAACLDAIMWSQMRRFPIRMTRPC